MKQFKFLILLAVCAAVGYVGCDDDDGPGALAISSITATGTDLTSGSSTTVDLNGATAAEDVPVDAVINVTFDRTVDANSVAGNVSISDGTNSVPGTVNVSGASITIDPTDDLARGTAYTLSMTSGIMAEDGGSLGAASRTFTTAGNVEVDPPKSGNQTAYWKFDGNANAAVGTLNGTAVGVEFQEDRFGFEGSAAYFDGDISLIEVANGTSLINESMTISWWMKLDTAGHVGGHFVMGIGGPYGFFSEVFGAADATKIAARYRNADQTTQGNDMFVNADGRNRDNGGWIGVEFEKEIAGGLASLFADQWAHVVFTYDAAINKRSYYVNGELIERDDLTMPPGTANFEALTFDPSATAETIGTGLAFGFAFDRTTTLWNTTGFGNYNSPDANHFKGWLDDVRFFDAPLTDGDVLTLYNAEK